MPTAYMVALDDSDAEQGGGAAKGTGMIKQLVKIATTTTAKQPTAKQPHTRTPAPTEYDEDEEMDISADPDDDQNPNHDEEDLLHDEQLAGDHGEDGSGDGFGGEEEEECEDDGNKKPAAKNTSPTSEKTKPTVYSSLVTAAENIIAAEEDYDDLLIDDLAWQSNTKGDATKLKLFKTEVLQHSGLVTFVFMRPGSTLLLTHHDQATLRGGGRRRRTNYVP